MKRKRSQRPKSPIKYPDGVMVETERATYYFRGGKRYKLYSPRVIKSWSLEPIVGSEASVKGTPLAKAPLGFRDGTLIHNFADGKIYLISGNRRRHITSPDSLARFGWSRRDTITVSDDEANLHREGEVLS